MLTIGADLGFGETGLALINDDEQLLAARSWAFPSSVGGTLERTTALARSFVRGVRTWIVEHPEEKDWLVGVETPVLKAGPGGANAVIYRMQAGYIAAAEQHLWHTMRADEHWWKGRRIRLVEFGPTTPKRILTGNYRASKAEMVDAFLRASKISPSEWAPSTLEAVADAYAHALAARDSVEWWELSGMGKPRGVEKLNWYWTV